MLDAVLKLSESPKLENGDYSQLVRVLLKVNVLQEYWGYVWVMAL